jgi:hypothetical protein
MGDQNDVGAGGVRGWNRPANSTEMTKAGGQDWVE